MLSDKLTETFSVTFRRRKDDGERDSIVDEFLHHLSGNTGAQIKKFGTQAGFVQNQTPVLQTARHNVRNVRE